MKAHDFVRPAIYARVSSEQQAEAGTIASQVQALRERVHQDQLLLEEALCFIDDGSSGTTLVRPALERLRDAAAAGDVDRLYVHSPDRLARKYAYQVLLLDELRRCGVEVVFLNHTAAQTPEEELLLQVQGMVAEYERAKLLERCRRGKLHAARQGCVSALAGAPYGYRYVRKADGGGAARYDILLEEARVVQEIFAWVGRDRLTLAEVCRRLRQQGVRTRTGNERWDPKTISDMLKNPSYLGTARSGRTQVGPRRPRLRPARGQPEQPRQARSVYPAEGPGVPIPVPALISPDLFAAAAEQLEENRRRSRQSARGARWLLQGLLVCQHCGYALYGMGTPHRLADGRRVVHSYYRCTGTNPSRFGGQRVCGNRPVRVDHLDEAVWRDVGELLNDPHKVAEEYRRREGGEKSAGDSVRGEQLAHQVRQVKGSIGRLIDAYQEGLLGKDEFEPRLTRCRERLTRLEGEREALADRVAREQELRLVLGGLEEFAARVKVGLAEADWRARREIIRAMVKRIEVGIDGVRIVYRISPPPFVNGPRGGTLQNCERILEPTLVEVPRAHGPVPGVVALRVRQGQPTHEPRQVPVALGPQDQMPMIGHDAVR